MTKRQEHLFTTTLQSRVAKQIAQIFAASRGTTVNGIIAAVSGGVDSIVMLDILQSLQKKSPFALGVAHFNHRLRGVATSDAAFVRALAEKCKLEFFESSGDVRDCAKKKKISIEMAARILRYDFFTKLHGKTDYQAIATAHTLNDNEETVLMNLLRGTGLAGIAGIPPLREIKAKKFMIRPMLTVSKDEVIQYAKVNRLQWREDATNKMLDARRNYIRRKLAPMLGEVNPKHALAVARLANITRNLLDDFRPQIKAARMKMTKQKKTGISLSIAIEPLKNYFNRLHTIDAIALQEILEETFNFLPSYEDIEGLCHLADRQTGARLILDKNLSAICDRDAIVITNENSALASTSQKQVLLRVNEVARIGGYIFSIRELPRAGIEIGETPMCEYVDADKAGDRFIIRPWAPGDLFMPLGGSTHKKVSDLLTDRKVNAATKKNALVLCSTEHIIWVCGMQIDNRVRIMKKTKRVLELKMLE